MNLEDRIVSEFKGLLKGQRLTPRQRQLVAEIAADFALLYTNAASGIWTEAQVRRQKALLDQQLAALKSIGVARAQALFYKALNLATSALVTAIVAA